MTNISKKVLYLSLFSLLIFVSGNFGQGSFLGVKKAFGYGGGGGYMRPTPTPTPTPIVQVPAVPAVLTAPSQVLGVAIFKFNQNLGVGSTGDDVLELQKRLTQEGVYTGPITGYYGNLTVAGVRAFQVKNSIQTAGVVGPETRIALNKELAGLAALAVQPAQKPFFSFVRTLAFGLFGEDVRELQKRMKDEGVYSGPVTGYFGQLTLGGVKNLQAKHNHAQVGIVGPLTKELLNKTN